MRARAIIGPVPEVRTMPVMTAVKMVPVTAEMAVAEMTAAVETTMAATVPHLDDAIVRRCGAEFGGGQRLRRRLRRRQHHQTRHGEKA